VFRQHYNALIMDGTHRHWQSGPDWFSNVTSDDGLAIAFAVRTAPGAKPGPTSGVHHYLGQDSTGEITGFHTSYTADFTPTEVTQFEVTGPDAARRFPKPAFTWAMQHEQLSVMIGEPRGSPFAAVAGQPGAAALTATLSRIGLAAACVGPDGAVLSANRQARAILQASGMWPASHLPLPLLRPVPGQTARPFALSRAETGLPVIVQVLPHGWASPSARPAVS
jgi:hypothetical protein